MTATAPDPPPGRARRARRFVAYAAIRDGRDYSA